MKQHIATQKIVIQPKNTSLVVGLEFGIEGGIERDVGMPPRVVEGVLLHHVYVARDVWEVCVAGTEEEDACNGVVGGLGTQLVIDIHECTGEVLGELHGGCDGEEVVAGVHEKEDLSIGVVLIHLF